MNIENSQENLENLSKAKQKLLKLEKEGKYVFHGSPTPDITELEPRQSYNYPDYKKAVKDGPPSVAASPYAEIAIFKALITKSKSGFNSDGHGNLNFQADQRVLDSAKNSTGYVYVLSKSDFYPKQGHSFEMDWRSEKPVEPLLIIQVKYQDLPQNIKLIED